VPRSIRLVTFDWDQTLWNSWDVHVAAAEHAAGVMGTAPPPKEWIASNFSVAFDRHMKLLFPENTREATRHYLEFYHSRVEHLASLFEGVTEMLAALKKRGAMLALLSDKRRVYGEQELGFAGIAHLFDSVLFLDGARAHKPHPQGLRQVMQALALDGEQVLFVGDSHVDVQCARRAGVASGAALWGSVGREALLKEHPDFVLEAPFEVVAALKG
jgi:pyrophosphatase PpaX